MSSVRHDALLQKEDLRAIESVLYEPVKKELTARQFMHVNSSFVPYAQEIGYDWYSMKGSAKILAAGGSAKDVPFVGEDGGRETQKVYDIITGIRYTRTERMAVAARNSLGKGPTVSLDMIRVTTARRFVAETENKIAFVGDKDHKIQGLLNFTGIKTEDVAGGANGSTVQEKRKWSNKTPQEILKDLLAGRTEAKQKKLFKANVLLISSNAYNQLLKPFSDLSDKTVLDWLRGQQDFKFEQILECEELDKEYNKISGDVDVFCICDNRPEVLELAIVEDLTLGEPVYDLIGTSEMTVTERIGGIILRHPTSVYIGKGI